PASPPAPTRSLPRSARRSSTTSGWSPRREHPQEQQARRLATGDEHEIPAPAAEVVEGVDRERLAVEAAPALQRHERVLEIGVEGKDETAGGLSGHVRADHGREGSPGCAHPAQVTQ